MRLGWKSTAASAGLIILLTVMAYFPALHNGFIWDDDDHFTQNPAMTSVAGLQQIWSSLTVSRYYPLTLTTFWVERRCWGLQPLPYHAVNIAFQAMNALLLWALLRRLRMRGAWVAAAIWAIHPVNVETVAWVTELKNTQSGFFFLLTLLLFLRFEDKPRPRDYWLTRICGIAAMLSKPSTVVLPAVMLLCVWWRRGRWTRRDWWHITPLAVLAAGMSVLTVVEQRGHIEFIGASNWTLTAAQRLMLASHAVWFYAGKLFWPVNLCFLYPRWELPVQSVLAWLPLAGLMIVAAMLWRCRGTDGGRLTIFGFGWFVIALLPVLGFFNIFFFLYSFVADHFQYLASIGLIAWAVGVGAGLVDRVGNFLTTKSRRPRRVGIGTAFVKEVKEQGLNSRPLSPPGEGVGVRGIIVTLIVALVLLLLGSSTWSQTRIYRDDETLWSDTLEKNPQAWLAHNNLGVVLMKTGRIAEAIRHYDLMLQINPDYPKGHYNLGICLLNAGRFKESIEQFERVLQLQPDNADAECNLGVAFVQLGNIAVAIEHYERALRLDPKLAGAHYNLGIALSQAGRGAEAMRHWEQAVRLNPDYAEAHNNLGVALSNIGREPEAIEHWEQAVRIKPDYAEAQNNLGVVLARLGRSADAIRHYEQALRINPNYAEAHNNLGAVFERAGRVQEAIAQYELALRIQPDLAAAKQSLARLGKASQ